ncbi:hypothetical protein D3C85_1303400 [compost metagenome]
MGRQIHTLRMLAHIDFQNINLGGYSMDDYFLVKDGKIVRWDGLTLGGTKIRADELVESFGRKALEEIERFGSYTIKKA